MVLAIRSKIIGIQWKPIEEFNKSCLNVKNTIITTILVIFLHYLVNSNSMVVFFPTGCIWPKQKRSIIGNSKLEVRGFYISTNNSSYKNNAACIGKFHEALTYPLSLISIVTTFVLLCYIESFWRQDVQKQTFPEVNGKLVMFLIRNN